jgi:hypothetical protein
MMCARTEVIFFLLIFTSLLNKFIIYRMLIEYYSVVVFYVLMIYQCEY